MAKKKKHLLGKIKHLYVVIKTVYIKIKAEIYGPLLSIVCGGIFIYCIFNIHNYQYMLFFMHKTFNMIIGFCCKNCDLIKKLSEKI